MSARDRRYQKRHDINEQRKLRAAAEAEVARLTLELSFAQDRAAVASSRAERAEDELSRRRALDGELRMQIDAQQIEIACLLETHRQLDAALGDVTRERDRYRAQALDYDRVRDERDKLRQRIDRRTREVREAPENRAALVFRAPKAHTIRGRHVR